MSEQWRPYLTNVNDELASVRVNLGLRSEAPVKDKPWLLWVWLYFQSPRPDGLSAGEEAPLLWKIEDALVAELARICNAVHCGCITTVGRREFYFYGTDAIGLAEVVADVCKNHSPYRCDFGSQQDDDWDQYINVLYPSQDQLDSIRNADVLEVMSNQGDNHEADREVMHWLYFPDQQSRERFVSAARGAGFLNVTQLNPPEDQDDDFGVTLVHFQSVTQAEIDKTTRALRTLAMQSNGEYDGWESQITSQ